MQKNLKSFINLPARPTTGLNFAYMKNLLLVFLLLPCIAFAQQSIITNSQKAPLPNDIDLRLANTQIEKGRKNVVVGLVLSALGTGVATLGPLLLNKPEQPTLEKGDDMNVNVSNAETIRLYNLKLTSYNKRANLYRGIGLGLGIGGGCFTLSGVIQIGKGFKLMRK